MVLIKTYFNINYIVIYIVIYDHNTNKITNRLEQHQLITNK
jgi:hypothetical protein